jgi:hypothetical protein
VRLALLVAVGLAALVAAPAAAHAYPQFQLTTGNGRCSLCHIAPAGGGLINGYGRSESGDTISQFGGNGDFLYGLYEEPDWIKLGVDLRGMGLLRDQGPDAELVAFPMQGDTYAAINVADFTFYTAIGPRAQARRAPSPALRMGAREYWLMWRPNTVGWYARAGRFMAPFGVRSADHTLYTRRYQGFYIYEETHNLSVGKVESEWEAHLTGFAAIPDNLLGHGPGESGATAYYERRNEAETIVLGGQARVGIGEDSARYTVGGIGKYWFEGKSVLVTGELDLTLQTFAADGSPSRPQLGSYLGATWIPKTGFHLTAAFERYDPDLSVKNLWHDAYGLSLQYFPLAHWEIMLQGKVELPGNYGRAQSLGFLQLHYYL